jgi:hypothetical protein
MPLRAGRGLVAAGAGTGPEPGAGWTGGADGFVAELREVGPVSRRDAAVIGLFGPAFYPVDVHGQGPAGRVGGGVDDVHRYGRGGDQFQEADGERQGLGGR